MSVTGRCEHLAVLLQLYDYQLEQESTTRWGNLPQVVNQLAQFIEAVGKINVT